MHPKLHEVRRAKAVVVAKMAALVSKEDDLTENESTEFEALKTEVARLNGRIALVEEVIAAQADAAEPVAEAEAETDTAADPAPEEVRRYVPSVKSAGARGFAEARKPELVGGKAARFVYGCLLAKNNGFRAAADAVHNVFKDNHVAKALNTVGLATGGALIPQAYAAEIIELLRAVVVVRKLNPMLVDMPGGNLTMGRLNSASTAGYQGELDDIAVSQPGFDDVQMNAKKLTAMVTVSNDLLRRSPLSVEQIIRDDMVQSLYLREDVAFLRGDGSGNSPVGLLNLCLPSAKLVALPLSADPNVRIQQVNGVLNGITLTLVNNLARMIRPCWIMHPTVAAFLSQLLNAQGVYIFKDDIAGGKLLGYPVETTTQLPTNLTTAAGPPAVNNGSEIYFVDFADIMLGETMEMRVDTSNEATYKDGGGNQVSTFQRDQTAFRLIEEHDLNTRHKAAIAVAVVPGWAPDGYTSFNAGSSYFVQAPNTLGSAAGSTGATNGPTGSSNPGNSSANVPGGTQPGTA